SLVWPPGERQPPAAADAKLNAVNQPDATDFMRAASLWGREKNWERAASTLQAGLQAHPQDITLGRSLADVSHATEVPEPTRNAVTEGKSTPSSTKAFRQTADKQGEYVG